MKKIVKDFIVVECLKLSPIYALIKLTPADDEAIPDILPGQFVQVEVSGSKTTFLRRPISICSVSHEDNELWLLVRLAGEGTAALLRSKKGDSMNLVLPLGNGFTMPEPSKKVLLVGGGVGVAPLLLLGKAIKEVGVTPNFLIGARSRYDLLLVDEFSCLGQVNISTDDGSAGEPGLVTQHSSIREDWDMIYCCGPAPMMKAVASVAKEIGAECEVSLENMMACGLGACLCCVEKTVKGNICVCTEGPVFNIRELTW